MQLQSSIHHVLQQLNASLEQLREDQFTMPATLLTGATIGQHVRHIIEGFLCLSLGYESGVVNYEKRKRDRRIETNKELACSLLAGIAHNLDLPDKALLLEANYQEYSSKEMLISTTYYRELLFNLDHAIHHMAMIRIGIAEFSDMELPAGFGVATSTIKYQQACAQ